MQAAHQRPYAEHSRPPDSANGDHQAPGSAPHGINHHKRFAALQAQAALAGFQLTHSGSGYMLSRVTHSRHCFELDAMQALMQRLGVI